MKKQPFQLIPPVQLELPFPPRRTAGIDLSTAKAAIAVVEKTTDSVYHVIRTEEVTLGSPKGPEKSVMSISSIPYIYYPAINRVVELLWSLDVEVVGVDWSPTEFYMRTPKIYPAYKTLFYGILSAGLFNQQILNFWVPPLYIRKMLNLPHTAKKEEVWKKAEEVYQIEYQVDPAGITRDTRDASILGIVSHVTCQRFLEVP
ncbi:MAG: hypothetical protein DSO01_05945 [Archaeoglobi archaeon]|nr:MAG: hypothetical protein DSO01_05945 [Archaeoglobi archaeon]